MLLEGDLGAQTVLLLLFPVTPAGSSHSNQALHLPHLRIQAPLLLRKSWYWNKTRFGSHQIVPGSVAVKSGHVELKHLVKGGLETKISKVFCFFFYSDPTELC